MAVVRIVVVRIGLAGVSDGLVRGVVMVAEVIVNDVLEHAERLDRDEGGDQQPRQNADPARGWTTHPMAVYHRTAASSGGLTVRKSRQSVRS